MLRKQAVTHIEYAPCSGDENDTVRFIRRHRSRTYNLGLFTSKRRQRLMSVVHTIASSCTVTPYSWGWAMYLPQEEEETVYVVAICNGETFNWEFRVSSEAELRHRIGVRLTCELHDFHPAVAKAIIRHRARYFAYPFSYHKCSEIQGDNLHALYGEVMAKRYSKQAAIELVKNGARLVLEGEIYFDKTTAIFASGDLEILFPATGPTKISPTGRDIWVIKGG